MSDSSSYNQEVMNVLKIVLESLVDATLALFGQREKVIDQHRRSVTTSASPPQTTEGAVWLLCRFRCW